MKKYFIIAIMLLSSLFLIAEELSMEEAVQKALEKNKDIKKAELNLVNYKMQKDEALRSGLFSVNYQGAYQKVDTRNTTLGDSFSHEIVLTQPIFIGGKVITGIKTSLAYEKMGQYTLENIKKTIRINTMSQYLNILMFEKNKELMENSLKELNENYKRLEEAFSLNMLTKTELLELKYSIIEAESSIIEIENAIEIYKLKLKNDIGMLGENELELLDIEDFNIDIESIDLESDLRLAKEKNLNIKVLEIGYKLKKEAEVLTRANLLPQVMFEFHYGGSEEAIGDAIDPDKLNWTASLNFSMNVWDWGNNYSEYKRDKNETEKTNLDVQKNIENIELGIRSKYLELGRLKKVLAAKEEGLKSAKENYELEKERYAADIITTTDFIAAQNRLISSETEIINTKLSYYLAYEMYKNEIEGEWN